MRLALMIAFAASPAAAWDFSADPVCTIWHDTGAAEMRVTFDPSKAQPYSIRVTRADGTWTEAPVYAIRFDGPRGFTITTNRHRLSEDGRAVIAADSGFGNVLRGLAQNQSATALLGDLSEAVPLDGAAEAVARFEDCTRPGMV